MRTVLVLAALNAAIWGAFLAVSPGSHYSAWPGSYRSWWFDDIPWAALLVSVVAPVLLTLPRVRLVRWVKWGLVAITTATMIAFLPYAALSGGGV